MGLKAKEYLGFEVLEGEEGNSFYGSRFGSSFRCLVEVWFLWSRLWIFNNNGNCKGISNDNNGETFEVLRIHCVVTLGSRLGSSFRCVGSADRGDTVWLNRGFVV